MGKESKRHHWITKSFIENFFKYSKIYNQDGKVSNPNNTMFSIKLYTVDSSFKNNLQKIGLPNDFLETCFSQAENKIFGSEDWKLYNILKKQLYDVNENIDLFILIKFIFFLLFLEYKTPEMIRRYILFEKLNSEKEKSFEEVVNTVKNMNLRECGVLLSQVLSELFKDKGELPHNVMERLFISNISILKTDSSFILTDTLFPCLMYDQKNFDKSYFYGWIVKGTIIFVPFDKNTYIMIEIGKERKLTNNFKRNISFFQKPKRELNDFDWNLLFNNQESIIDFYLLNSETTTYLNKIFFLQSKKSLRDFEKFDYKKIEFKKCFSRNFYLNDNNKLTLEQPGIILGVKKYNYLLSNIKRNKLISKKVFFSRDYVKQFSNLLRFKV